MPSSATADLSCPPCRFGGFELRPDARLLLADGAPVALGARAFDLLVALVARAGQLVSKNDLLELVWPGLVVEENNLQVQVSTLRKLLGPSALATIPGRGYRFALPVEQADGGSATHGAQSPARPLGVAPGDAQPSGATGSAAAAVATAAPAPAHVPPPHRAPTNLPLRLPSLYGRAADIEAIKALLARHVVLTVAGAGGIGKTRIAQAVAAQLAVERAADFPDGIWWVELASLSDGALVPSAVARVLDTVLGADRPPADTIAAVLAPQRVLLALDNCEHLADDVAAFVDALCAAAPGLRVLVTSQETLKTADEHVYRLGALAVPAADTVGDADAPPTGAMELFVARAESVDPRFALTLENTQAVAEICRRLDGIPLAIELAAARLPLLGIEGLRARLDERFNVLTGGARVVLRRHQTLRATLEWSHGLLTPEEQTVFRRLGVFAGSFTLEAAQHVVQEAAIDQWAALDHLGALVDKSLVLAEGDPVPRYRLLETTRAYALERLGEAGETDAMLRRHAEALLQVLIGFEREIAHSRDMRDGLRAAAELDNLRAALAWAATADVGGELALALAGNSAQVWNNTYLLTEGMDRCLTLRDCVDDGVPPAVEARYWLVIAQLGLYSHRREAFDAAGRAATLYRQLGDARQLFDALVTGAAQGIRFGTFEEMEAAITEAAGLVRPDWSAKRRALLEFVRGRWFLMQGRDEEWLAASQRQAAIRLNSGDEIGMHYAMSNVVAAEMRLGRTEIALAHARESIARLDVIGGSEGAGHLWLTVLGAEALLGRIDAAVAAGRTAYALLLREGDESRVFWGLALCAALQGRAQDAARIIGYRDAVMARAGVGRQYYAASNDDTLELSLRAGLPADELARLRAEGAAMREEDVVRLMLGQE